MSVAETISAPTRPALRYHGGKWRLAHWIISHFPKHRVYCEPYGGAASVLLRKPRSYSEIYSELDGDICNVFRVLRDPVSAALLRQQLMLTPYSRLEFEQSYTPCDDPIESARRTLVRSYMGFGSAAASAERTGFRANANRNGTTPAHDWANFPDVIPAFTARLSGVVLECRDAIEVIKQQDSPSTLFYVDPPYVHGTRCKGNIRENKGYRHEMTDDQHCELASVLRSLDGMVVLSGYQHDLYAELYSDWECRRRATHADGARKRTECLWLSPSVTARLDTQSMFGGHHAD